MFGDLLDHERDGAKGGPGLERQRDRGADEVEAPVDRVVVLAEVAAVACKVSITPSCFLCLGVLGVERPGRGWGQPRTAWERVLRRRLT